MSDLNSETEESISSMWSFRCISWCALGAIYHGAFCTVGVNCGASFYVKWWYNFRHVAFVPFVHLFSQHKIKTQSRNCFYKQKVSSLLCFYSHLPLSPLFPSLVLSLCTPSPTHTIFLTSSESSQFFTLCCEDDKCMHFRPMEFQNVLWVLGSLQRSQGLTTHSTKRTFWRVAGNNWSRACSVQGTLEFS